MAFRKSLKSGSRISCAIFGILPCAQKSMMRETMCGRRGLMTIIDSTFRSKVIAIRYCGLKDIRIKVGIYGDCFWKHYIVSPVMKRVLWIHVLNANDGLCVRNAVMSFRAMALTVLMLIGGRIMTISWHMKRRGRWLNLVLIIIRHNEVKEIFKGSVFRQPFGCYWLIGQDLLSCFYCLLFFLRS